MVSSMAAMHHPYSPASLELPGFVPGSLSQVYILGVFGAVSVAVVGVGWIISGRFKYLSTVERTLACWWLYTGLVHMVLEGYFVFTPDFFRKTNFFAEAWKEYGKGDSRYPARDTTTVLLEGITAVIEGPAALLAVFGILYRKSYEHVLPLAISLGQLYGDIMYTLTAYFEKEAISAPGPVYFWGYLVFMNSIWVVVPILTAIRAWNKICDSQLKSTVSTKKTE